MRNVIGACGLMAVLLGTFGCGAAPSQVQSLPNGAPSDPATPPAEPAGPAPEDLTRAAELYEELERQVALYRDGLDLLRDGEEVAGETVIADATRGLSLTYASCASTPGCDLTRIWAASERLLSEQSLVVKFQANELRDVSSSACLVEDLDSDPRGLDLTLDGPGVQPALGVPEVQRTVAMLRGTDLRDLITLNGPVKAALDDWLTWLRPELMTSYENYMFLRERIAPIYDEAGLPEALLFGMIATETHGKVHATSRAGARGILQFMRYTGQKYGLHVVDGFDERLDPVEATRANVGYLNDLFELLNNDLEKALASYNAGEGRLMRLNRRLGDISMWDRSFYYSLPRETRDYVPRIFAAAWLFLHPEEYNLEWPALGLDETQLVLQRETSLSELTVCLGHTGESRGGWFRTLRNLNPRIDPSDRLEPGYVIAVPGLLAQAYTTRCLGDDGLLQRAQELHAANYPDSGDMIQYTVRTGDTLGKIANRHRCISMRELADLNRVRPPRYVISVGQTLQIPDCM